MFIVEYFLHIILKPSRRLTDKSLVIRYVKMNYGNRGLTAMNCPRANPASLAMGQIIR